MTEFHRHCPKPLREVLAFLLLSVLCLIVFFISLDAFFGNASEEFRATVSFFAVIPALLLAVKLVGRRPLYTLIGSAEWRLPLVVSVVVAVAALTIARPSLHWSAILLAVPILAFMEELLFRAWLPQVLGAWIRPGLVAFVLPAPLFALMHVPESPMVWLNHLVPGLCFGLLAWAYQGLLAPTILHSVSNLTVSLAQPGFPEVVVWKCSCLVLATCVLLAHAAYRRRCPSIFTYR